MSTNNTAATSSSAGSSVQDVTIEIHESESRPQVFIGTGYVVTETNWGQAQAGALDYLNDEISDAVRTDDRSRREIRALETMVTWLTNSGISWDDRIREGGHGFDLGFAIYVKVRPDTEKSGEVRKDTAGDQLVAAVLTPEQQSAVHFYRTLNVPASWFVGVPDETGRVEVLALGNHFIWSLRIDADGDTHSSEAKVTDFDTGIDC